jgi:predicted nucleic acid-binding Zn ribbon protein
MPIYEYRRPDGTTFEIQQSFSDDPLSVDPDTGVPVERVLHPPAVHFKGKGFYSTDYGSRARQRETAAAAEGGSGSEGGGDGGEGKGKDAAKPAASGGGGEKGAGGGEKGAGGGTGEGRTSKPAAGKG